MKRIITLLAVLLLVGVNLLAQETNPSRTQFMFRGYGQAGFDYMTSKNDTTANFIGMGISPIFLIKHGDRFLFETEMELELENGELEVALEYADLMYTINNYLMIRAGKFLLPVGTFLERMHPAWINRLSTKPLGLEDDGIAPESDIGVELRGAAPIGGTTINYSLFVTNGPSLRDGSEEPEEAGMLNFENWIDNNNNKFVGGRIGFLPLYNSSMEIGWSFYKGKVGDKNSIYKDVNAFIWAADFSYVKQISAIKGVLDIKGQYNNTKVSDAYYPVAGETRDTTDTYTFNNTSQSYYGQLSYRPSMASSKFLKNLEIVGRYCHVDTPKGAAWEYDRDELAFGLNYWISWRQVVKLSYALKTDNPISTSPEGTAKLNTNAIYLHWAIGF